MGLRAEHLQGIAERILDLEGVIRVFSMERLFEIVMRLGKEKEALEIAKIFQDLYFDRGTASLQDLRKKLMALDLQTHPALSEIQKGFIMSYLDYVVPPTQRRER